ncbi:GTPase [Halomicronema hongdechloris C2206]|uniref:GTPase n=1 Tax=Halomicronema hongdechloris C2206 TaxID=1641165 RepID=A0A1Z3HH62_9CYAN|nr:DUF697 domain-containing protein [Halomicronema hongdechloris]ASC69662.1 GTPase [Halomicronema hongdechloris C2206]
MTSSSTGANDPGSAATEQALADLIADFDALQTDLHYQEAQAVLQQLVDRLELSPRERAGLEDDIASLTGLLTKLEQAVIHIAVFGLVGRGKSSLLNALLGQSVFATGPTHGITQQVESSRWQMHHELLSESPGQSLVRVSLPGIGQSRIELVDTPGLDEVAGEQREALAQRIARQVDLILFVVAGDITRVEYQALENLRQAGKPLLLVFNKIDHYPQLDRQAIYETLRDRRLQELIAPEDIVMAAAAPLVVEAVKRPDGQIITQTRRGAPQVDALKLKILEILHRDGKSLIALNTLLYADTVNQQLLQRKQQICDRIADDAIWTAVMTKAMAVAINPIMVADLLGGAAVDVALITTLSRLYGLPMTQTGALNLLRQMALGLGGLPASELLVTFGLSSLKGLLGLSTIATGGLSLPPYLSVALTQAAVAGVSTYGIGQVAKAYLVNGATWGPEGPKAVVSRILNSLDEQSILNRVKTELQTRLERE